MQRVNKFIGRRCDLLNGLIESGFIRPRRAGRAAHLSDKLQRRSTNFVVRRGWLKVG